MGLQCRQCFPKIVRKRDPLMLTNRAYAGLGLSWNIDAAGFANVRRDRSQPLSQLASKFRVIVQALEQVRSYHHHRRALVREEVAATRRFNECIGACENSPEDLDRQHKAVAFVSAERG